MNNREWLYGMEPSELAAWFDAEHVEPNGGIRLESVVRQEMADANDSREKLEADVGFIVKEGFVTYKGIIDLLDRQAAITANETNYNNPYVGLVRGKQWERTEISDYYCGRCGWKVTDHDSYCPECGGALHKASNKPDSKFDARKTAETAETCAAKCDIRDFDDSREKLEAEIYEWCDYHSDELEIIAGWLDRQAAITYSIDAWYIEKLVDERESLQDQVDDLQANLNRANDAFETARLELEEQIAELERECDGLAIDLERCDAEREHYRNLNSELMGVFDEARHVVARHEKDEGLA